MTDSSIPRHQLSIIFDGDHDHEECNAQIPCRDDDRGDCRTGGISRCRHRQLADVCGDQGVQQHYLHDQPLPVRCRRRRQLLQHTARRAYGDRSGSVRSRRRAERRWSVSSVRCAPQSWMHQMYRASRNRHIVLRCRLLRCAIVSDQNQPVRSSLHALMRSTDDARPRRRRSA